MNCDRVFAVLTRGPFPTGASSDFAVEAHLAVCPACHRLAEALRPASDLDQEAVTPEESRGLPGYWGEIHAVPSDLAISCIEDRRQQEPDSSTAPISGLPALRWSSLNFWRFAAAVALGATLGGVLRSSGSLVDRPGRDDADSRTLSSHSQTRSSKATDTTRPTNRQLLASLHRPACCMAAQPSGAIVQPDDSSASDVPRLPRPTDISPPNHQVCCTQCHHAGAARAGAGAVRHSCALCHGDMPRPATEIR